MGAIMINRKDQLDLTHEPTPIQPLKATYLGWKDGDSTDLKRARRRVVRAPGIFWERWTAEPINHCL